MEACQRLGAALARWGSPCLSRAPAQTRTQLQAPPPAPAATPACQCGATGASLAILCRGSRAWPPWGTPQRHPVRLDADVELLALAGLPAETLSSRFAPGSGRWACSGRVSTCANGAVCTFHGVAKPQIAVHLTQSSCSTAETAEACVSSKQSRSAFRKPKSWLLPCKLAVLQVQVGRAATCVQRDRWENPFSSHKVPGGMTAQDLSSSI